MKLYLYIVVLALLAGSSTYGSDDDRTITLLKKLSEAPGASGFEGPVRSILREEWHDLLPDLYADGMGNLIGNRTISNKKPRVLIMAHMDEVGFLVRGITDSGFVYMQPVGDWIDPVLLAQTWIITTPKGPVIGYSGVESIHATGDNPSISLPSQQQIFLDIGAKNKEEARLLGVRPGLPITPKTSFQVLQGTSRYIGKAFDDRALLAVVTESLQQLKKKELAIDIVVAATVQEEPGMRGSLVVFDQTKPDIVINLDVGIARDFPLYFSEGLSEPVLGKGPTVFVFDWSMIPNDKLVQYVVEIAQMTGIPLQYEVEDNYGQDGCNMQRSAKGIPVINLGLPVRYPHSQSGIMDRADYDQMIKLLVALIENLSSEKFEDIKCF